MRVVKTQPNPKRWQTFCSKYQLDWNYTRFKRNLVKGISDQPRVYCFHLGHGLSCLPAWGLALRWELGKVLAEALHEVLVGEGLGARERACRLPYARPATAPQQPDPPPLCGGCQSDGG